MVEPQSSKLITRVRFPSPALPKGLVTGSYRFSRLVRDGPVPRWYLRPHPRSSHGLRQIPKIEHSAVGVDRAQRSRKFGTPPTCGRSCAHLVAPAREGREVEVGCPRARARSAGTAGCRTGVRAPGPGRGRPRRSARPSRTFYASCRCCCRLHPRAPGRGYAAAATRATLRGPAHIGGSQPGRGDVVLRVSSIRPGVPAQECTVERADPLRVEAASEGADTTHYRAIIRISRPLASRRSR